MPQRGGEGGDPTEKTLAVSDDTLLRGRIVLGGGKVEKDGESRTSLWELGHEIVIRYPKGKPQREAPKYLKRTERNIGRLRKPGSTADLH